MKQNKKSNVGIVLLILVASIIAGVLLGLATVKIVNNTTKVLECNMYNYDFGQDYFIKQDNYFNAKTSTGQDVCCVILNRIGTICAGACQVSCMQTKVKQ